MSPKSFQVKNTTSYEGLMARALLKEEMLPTTQIQDQQHVPQHEPTDQHTTACSIGDEAAQVKATEVKATFWYPLKLITPAKLCRVAYFADRKTRKVALKTILRHQGFVSPLDLYTLDSLMYDEGHNDIYAAKHNITGQRVVIKVICKSKYKYLRR